MWINADMIILVIWMLAYRSQWFWSACQLLQNIAILYVEQLDLEYVSYYSEV